jgi:heme/copper-type cytochrome/quinol oxidase subunit 1
MFGAFSGVLGFIVSMIMRLELSQAGDAFLNGNYQLYNVLVTSHAFLMIFLCAVSVIFVYNYKLRFMKLLGLFGRLIKHLTNFKGKPIEDNSMSRKRR